MQDFTDRTCMILGNDAVKKLQNSSVIVFGIGGVGSYTVEALARCGVGRIGVCDADKICESNINRQLFALTSTIGKKKTDVAAQRIFDINPNAKVDTYDFFYDETTQELIDLLSYDYIVDAIDSMDSKVLLIKKAHLLGIGIVSALSAGNKLDPYRFETSDIYSTSVCPIAKILRKRLRDENVESHKVVYSKESPCRIFSNDLCDGGKRTVGSISFVPSVMGLLLAKEAICDLIERE